MKMKLLLATLIVLPAPAHAQVELPTDQLDQHADIVRQRILRDKTVNRPRDGSPDQATRERQARACANRALFARQHGADDPRVRRLHELCEQAGY